MMKTKGWFPRAALLSLFLLLALQHVGGVRIGSDLAYVHPIPRRLAYVVPRGGATSTLTADDEGYDEEEDEDEEEPDPSMVKSMLKSSRKSKAKAAAAVKEEVSRKLKSASKKRPLIPYIIRASLNPFTVFSMTKAYFQSLFNINFLKEDSTAEGLRSALEEKAKKSASSGGGRKKGKRQMRPGQAKTLSDLPQLNT